MRILVYEFVTGGGLAGRPAPRSLSRQGLAMRTALLEDLSAMTRHEIVVTTDVRFAQPAPRGVEMVIAGSDAAIDAAADTCDAVWLVAPETGGCLERLANRIERSGKTLLGASASAVRLVADKSCLPRCLAQVGVPHPETALIGPRTRARLAADRLGYPVVVKPASGAGCYGVRLARDARELRSALQGAHHANGCGPLIMQQYVRGKPVSVSLVSDGRRAVPLAVNAQQVRVAATVTYRGGSTPFDHPLAAAAADAAVRTCAAIPGLRGYVGVDLVLAEKGPVVIEVNPRLTMAYVGIRAALDSNPAALALEACRGRLPVQPSCWQRVRFSAAGQVVAIGPRHDTSPGTR